MTRVTLSSTQDIPTVSVVDTVTETLGLLARTKEQLDHAWRQIEAEHLGRQTPCTDWRVSDLLAHLIAGEASVPPWLRGDAFIFHDELADDHRSQWRQLADEADTALAAPGAFGAVVEHPTAGTITGELLAGFRGIDRLVHAWDLLVSIDAPDQLNMALVYDIYGLVLPFADFIATTPGFVAVDEPPATADVQTRLLALFGRARSAATTHNGRRAGAGSHRGH